MIKIRKSQERGLASHGWLNSSHTFSFADYYDPNYMGFGPLRVINEDRIEGGTGFGTHGHENMEIISYVIEGALQHKDSMGNETVIKPGEVQRLSAGTGIRHSEHNEIKDKTTHFLQIWIMPEKNGVTPGYGQKSFEAELRAGGLVLVASKAGRNGSITLNQDVDMYVAKASLAGHKTVETSKQRKLWVQVISGQVEVESSALGAGDGAAISDVNTLELKWSPSSEFIVFDMPS